jgi:dephospho-CoA kinase
MKTIGLTGGIGMGKSTAGRLLRERGVAVVDTDELARQLVELGQPALAEIRATFGEAVLSSDGRLRRGSLAQIVFADVAARQRLEAILHPRIREAWRTQLAAWRAEETSLAAAIIPLLFEIGAQGEFDATVCVACSPATQRQRLRARGWPDEQTAQRIQAQMPIEQKMALARCVIWNEGKPVVLAAQLDRLLAALEQLP